jgi:hypothetical protein
MAGDDDSFTEVTTTSWFSRLGGSLAGVAVGFILFFASFFVLYWNEGRAVEAALALDAGAKAVITVSADKVDPANEGKLIHLAGRAAAPGRVEDPAFHVGSTGLLRIERKVEMMQWREQSETKTEKSVGGSETTTTTYRYVKEWSETPLNSTDYKKRQGHENPPMPYRTTAFDAEGAKLGAFTLDKSQLQKLGNFIPFSPQADSGKSRLPQGFRWHGETLYRGADPQDPALGDLRVSFRVVEAQPVSIVAAQLSGGLSAFIGRGDYKVELVEPGLHTADAMFKSAKEGENVVTWILRVVGFFMMFFGVMLIAGPLAWLASVIPFLETLVNGAAAVVAFLVAAPLTLFTIAAAWLIHRPLIGGGIILAAVIITVAVRKMAPRAAPASAPMGETATGGYGRGS